MIAVIDYGAGNIQSVMKALRHIGCDCVLTNSPEIINSASGAILPGVGSFGDCMDNIEKSNLTEVIKNYANSGKPFMGICLGLQLLFPESEESPNASGLGLLKGTITKIPKQEGIKVPHMGWNSLNIRKNDGLFKGIEGNPYVYFVHSYYLTAEDKDIVSADTFYSTEIHAAVQYKNIHATQFHPEKSGEVRLKILRNFADMTL